MPLYDFLCECGEITEKRQGYDVAVIPCPLCGGSAKRQAVYLEQYTRTESGGMQGKMGSSHKLAEGAERVARNSVAIEKETGQKSGPRLR